MCVCVCVCVSVCLSVTTKSATYLVYTWKTRYHRVLYGVFKDFVVSLSLKTLHSRVMASFAGHHHFLAPYDELTRFPSPVMAYFQLQGYVSLAVYMLVSSPDPTLEREKGLVTLGKKLGPIDDPRRNLRVPIRLQH